MRAFDWFMLTTVLAFCIWKGGGYDPDTNKPDEFRSWHFKHVGGIPAGAEG